MKDKPMITRNKLRSPEQLTGRYEIRPVIAVPKEDLILLEKPEFPHEINPFGTKESISATTDLIKTTPESIRKSWGDHVLAPVPATIEDESPRTFKGDFLFASIPGTIEDELPPVSQAFADKVKAMGGIMTPYGLICDPKAPVVGKRYMRLARVFFSHMYNDAMRHVEDAEFRIRSFAGRNKQKPDWEFGNASFIKCLQFAIKHRHIPGRKPVYANEE